MKNLIVAPKTSPVLPLPIIFASLLLLLQFIAHGEPEPLCGVLSQMAGGNTVGGEVREHRPRSDGYRHIDTPAMIRRLKEMHVNTCNYVIWNSPTDFDDLRNEFLPAAQKADLNVWAYLVPPAETSARGKGSDPYRTNYLEWSRQLAKLSLQFTNLQAWVMDDFTWNMKTFTPQYVAELQKASHAINPNFHFFAVIHFTAVTDRWVSDYADAIDGAVCPYLDLPYDDTQRVTSLNGQIEAVRAKFSKPLYVLFYSGRHLGSPLEPTPAYVDAGLEIVLKAMKQGRIAGVVAYGAPLDPATPLTSPNVALQGKGRLSLAGAATQSGTNDFAEASQTIYPDPQAPRYVLTFWHHDSWGAPPYPRGLFAKQVLIDNEVVWASDPAADIRNTWLEGGILQGPVNLTSRLKGKHSAKLTLRLASTKSGPKPPIDVSFDALVPQGFRLENPGFENTNSWRLKDSNAALLAAIDVYEIDRPQKMFATLAKRYKAFSREASKRKQTSKTTAAKDL